MTKKLNILSSLLMLSLALLLSACAGDSAMEDNNTLEASKPAIGFNTGLKHVTRAGETKGQQAAELLGNKFVVYGQKNMSESENQNVFLGYTVNYISNSAKTTETNTNNWEYVGQQPENASLIQSIKYWDYSASNYKFLAYSLGKGETSGSPAVTTYATVGGTPGGYSTYSLSGTLGQLTQCYVSNITKVEKTNYNNAVKIQFFNLASKIRLGLYETIPGYSVKEVKFYPAATSSNTELDTKAILYASTASLPSASGSYVYTVTFADDKASISRTQQTGTEDTKINIGDLKNFANREYQEPTSGEIYLGRTSNNATITDYLSTLPVSLGTDLHLKADYTLVSLDTDEEINVKGASATIPAAYTAWKSNYAYTYLFKISDNTNGQTGTGQTPSGLYPMTFDAYYTTDDNGNTTQGTITTFGEYSITTYQKGSVTNEGISYSTNKFVYVSVVKNEDKSQITLDGTNEYIMVYKQTIDDESVVETSTDNSVGAGYNFDEADRRARFTPTATGTYRVEYWHKEGDNAPVKRAVKIVKIDSESSASDGVPTNPDEWDNDYRRARNRR